MSQTIRVVTGLTRKKKRVAPPQMEALRKDPHLYETLKAIDRQEHVEPVFEDIVIEPGPPTPGGATSEMFVTVDTSAGDEVYTLPDPTTLPDLKTPINVLNWNGGIYEMHIAPGVGGTIQGSTDGIRTRTNNQSYRLLWGPAIDTNPQSGWVSFETEHGGDTGPAAPEPPWINPVPGLVACDPSGDIFSTIVAENIQIFTSDGTWTKPTDQTYRFTTVVGWGGGGAGGGGNALYGGAGGAGSPRKVWIYDFASLPATVAVTIGSPGTGGTGGTHAAPLSATAGTDGGNSTFGSLTFYGGAGGGVAGAYPSAAVGGGGGGETTAGSGSQGGDNPSASEGANGSAYEGGNGLGQRVTNVAEGCAECGGGAGAGSGSTLSEIYGWSRRGGSSLSGGGGGGGGGPIINDTGGRDFGMGGGDGGTSGSDINGGGGRGGVGGYYPDSTMGGQPGSDGPAGVGMRGGSGGGGGAGLRRNGAGTGGNGGAGGAPGGGGGGAGGFDNVGSSTGGGVGGAGARGEVRVYSWR